MSGHSLLFRNILLLLGKGIDRYRMMLPDKGFEDLSSVVFCICKHIPTSDYRIRGIILLVLLRGFVLGGGKKKSLGWSDGLDCMRG